MKILLWIIGIFVLFIVWTGENSDGGYKEVFEFFIPPETPLTEMAIVRIALFLAVFFVIVPLISFLVILCRDAISHKPKTATGVDTPRDRSLRERWDNMLAENQLEKGILFKTYLYTFIAFVVYGIIDVGIRSGEGGFIEMLLVLCTIIAFVTGLIVLGEVGKVLDKTYKQGFGIPALLNFLVETIRKLFK